MKIVSFEPDSLILPDEGVLYVINPRGVCNVRSRNISKIHEALKPHIEAMPSLETLLGSVVASQRATIEKYLTTLHEAGAIRFHESGTAETEQLTSNQFLRPEDLGSDCRRASISIGDRRVFVSLDGVPRSIGGEHDVCIFFLRPDRVGREILSLGRARKIRATIVYVVVKPADPTNVNPSVTELERRGMYARWLLLRAANLPKGYGRVLIYTLDESTGTLALDFDHEISKPSDLRIVPQRLNLVKAADVDQVPLVVATVSHPFFQMSLTRVGLRYHEVCEELVSEFIVRTASLGPAGQASATAFVELIGGDSPDRNVRRISARAVDIKNSCFAGSLLHLRVGLLELYAAERVRASNLLLKQDLDLLKEPASDPDVMCLVEALGLRASSLPARLLTTTEGLFIYECLGRRSCAFIQLKALRDILIALVRDTFYANELPQPEEILPAADFTRFITNAGLRRIVNERLADVTREYGAAQMTYCKVRCWGRTVWFGHIEEQ